MRSEVLRLAEQYHAEDRDADRADAGPDRVAGADRDGAHREREEVDARDHRRDGDRRGHEAREAVGVLQADRPDDFEQAGER